MDLLLSKILGYLNGSLQDDVNYQFCKFIINNYLELEDMSFDDVINQSGIGKEEILGFCNLLGFSSYEQFVAKLIRDHFIRLDQIRARMLGLDSDELINKIEIATVNAKIKEYITMICEAIFKAKRIIFIGALYPLSIAVELQTDLINLGKVVLQYHEYDQDLVLDENDVTIFISATGRSMNSFMKIKKELAVEKTTSILITQNKIYTLGEYKLANYVIQIPGKFDGIDFNYQIRIICDIIRVYYYQKYFL